MRRIYLRYAPRPGGCEGRATAGPCRFLAMCRQLVAMEQMVMCELPDEEAGIDALAQRQTSVLWMDPTARSRDQAFDGRGKREAAV